jgi:hypothetical protein
MNFPTRRLAVLAQSAAISAVVSLPLTSVPVGAVEQTCRVFVASADMTIAVACPTSVVGPAVPPLPATTGLRAVHKARVNPNITRIAKPVREQQPCYDMLERTQLGDAAPDDVSMVRNACRK